ncbi:DNA-directed DNA polymerases [Zea mays]|uniref:DNA polymerase delta subunit 3 n=1 Tax=Zea mays TaxID=4577 RepID=A0A1D6IUX3_MAIZE|nr:DNA-directed DNA polymerases [Zea mays]
MHGSRGGLDTDLVACVVVALLQVGHVDAPWKAADTGPRGNERTEARQIFKDSCSVQIYSIQACIPKDTAILWNHEFVHAEEIFNQPFDYENCLRDNRYCSLSPFGFLPSLRHAHEGIYSQFCHFTIMHKFCGVLNSFVKRTSNGKHVSSLPPKPLNSAAVVARSKPSVTPKEQFVTARRQDLPVSSKQGAGTKSEKDNSTILDKVGNGPVVKEQSVDTYASKSKAQNGKAMPSNGGSLANMWGRASAKPMPPSTTNSTAVASVAATADAQICAKEEADGNSSDDEHGIKYKRGSTNANNRKRRVNFGCYNELPKQHTPDLVVGIADDAEVNQKSLENEYDLPNNGKGSTTLVDSDFTSECKIKTIDPMNDFGITLKEKSSDPPINDKKQRGHEANLRHSVVMHCIIYHTRKK